MKLVNKPENWWLSTQKKQSRVPKHGAAHKHNDFLPNEKLRVSVTTFTHIKDISLQHEWLKKHRKLIGSDKPPLDKKDVLLKNLNQFENWRRKNELLL